MGNVQRAESPPLIQPHLGLSHECESIAAIFIVGGPCYVLNLQRDQGKRAIADIFIMGGPHCVLNLHQTKRIEWGTGNTLGYRLLQGRTQDKIVVWNNNHHSYHRQPFFQK